mgnify:CR=1 FL=1
MDYTKRVKLPNSVRDNYLIIFKNLCESRGFFVRFFAKLFLIIIEIGLSCVQKAAVVILRLYRAVGKW